MGRIRPFQEARGSVLGGLPSPLPTLASHGTMGIRAGASCPTERGNGPRAPTGLWYPSTAPREVMQNAHARAEVAAAPESLHLQGGHPRISPHSLYSREGWGQPPAWLASVSSWQQFPASSCPLLWEPLSPSPGLLPQMFGKTNCTGISSQLFPQFQRL